MVCRSKLDRYLTARANGETRPYKEWAAADFERHLREREQRKIQSAFMGSASSART
jgi:hypothetical protein